jgi:saccharopine dehydrogenase (NAD+, L-lysine-forming)
MVRYSANEFDEIYSANVYSYLNIDWDKYQFSPSTGREMIDEFNDYNPSVFFEGKWKKLKWGEYKKFDFGKSVGKHYAAPMMLEEMKFLPKAIPSLNETGFFVGGFNWFVNYISIPIVMISLKISESLFSKPAAKLFEFGLKKFSKPPYICSLKLKAFGRKNNKNVKFQIEVSHSDGYLLTAVPVVACLFQYLDGSVRKPGLHFQANVVEPKRFFKDLQMMGIDAIVTER